MATRAKFKCVSITEREAGAGKTTKDVKLQPVYAPYKNGQPDPDHPNTAFYAATPSGEIVLGIANPDAVAQFAIGREYFVDFTPAT